jgi:hypothetical protein
VNGGREGTEQTVLLAIRAGGEIQRAGLTIFPVIAVIGTAGTKVPQAIDGKDLSLESVRQSGMVHRADELAGRRIVAIVFGILEPETIKQMAQPASFASISPKLSSQPYSRWRRLQGSQGVPLTMAPPGSGRHPPHQSASPIKSTLPEAWTLTLWCPRRNVKQLGLRAVGGRE